MSTPDQITKFLNWEQASRDTIDVKRIYIDMAEDLIAGIMLSQILYWFLPNKLGASKTRVERDDQQWIAKKTTDWFVECRISKKQASACIDKLEKLGLIVTGMFHFGGRRMTHLRINWEVFLPKFTMLANSIHDEAFLKAYWDAIKEKDNRTNVSKLPSSQNGMLPKRAPETLVSSQKGNLGVYKKDTSCTEITAEITNTENTIAVREPRIEDTTNETINSKADVTVKILELKERLDKADAYVHVVEYKRNGEPLKRSIETPEFTFREGKIFTVLKDAFHLISSGSLNWAREGKHLRELILMATRESRFTLDDILECTAWAYHTEQFDYYAMSALSIPKLMPKFLNIKRTGRLADSLQMKPKFETSAQRTERIYAEQQQNRDRDLEAATELAKEYARQRGVTKPERI